MLTPPAKKILHQLRMLTRYTECPFSPAPDRTTFFMVDDPGRRLDLSQFRGEIWSCLVMLKENGYIVSLGKNYQLTQKAIHREYIRFSERRTFLYRSVFTPIAVSFLTTLVTLWLKGLFL